MLLLAIFVGVIECASAVDYAYDPLNRLARIDYGGGVSISYSYDAAGNRLSMLSRSIGTGYDAWTTLISNGQTNYDQSAAGDEYPNLLKYATGSSPTNTDGLARLGAVPVSNGVIALQFNRNTNAVDVTIILESRSSLTDETAWDGFATNHNGLWLGVTNVAEAGTGSPVSVVVQDPSVTATNRFLRLRITRP